MFKSKILENLKTVTKQKEQDFKNDKTLEKYKKASEEYELLISEGIVMRRESNLLSMDKKHLQNSSYTSNL
jgi:BioD-like phosphotransacetylase family protein